MQSKVLAKIEQIARLRVAGVKDSRIAQMLGMSYGGLTRILQTDFYRKREAEVRQNLVSQMDKTLIKTRTDLLQNELQDAVPDAVRFIIDTCRKGADLRARMAAAKEILDRDRQRAFVKQAAASPRDANASASTVTPTLPEGVMDAARREGDKASEILIRVPAPTGKEVFDA